MEWKTQMINIGMCKMQHSQTTELPLLKALEKLRSLYKHCTHYPPPFTMFKPFKSQINTIWEDETSPRHIIVLYIADFHQIPSINMLLPMFKNQSIFDFFLFVTFWVGVDSCSKLNFCQFSLQLVSYSAHHNHSHTNTLAQHNLLKNIF